MELIVIGDILYEIPDEVWKQAEADHAFVLAVERVKKAGNDRSEAIAEMRRELGRAINRIADLSTFKQKRIG